MNWGIACAMLLLCSPTVASATAGACPSGAGAGIPAGISTPARGSPEREAILGELRAFTKRMSDLDMVFVVRHLKSGCGWAWIEADPRSADGTQHYEQVQVLLARRNGRWAYVESLPEWSECEPDPDCIHPARYFRKLAARHPGVPPGIFPVASPRD